MHGRELLIEQDPPNRPSGRPRGTEYEAIRTDRYKFVRYWNDEIELYDLVADPYELDNLAPRPGVRRRCSAPCRRGSRSCRLRRRSPAGRSPR